MDLLTRPDYNDPNALPDFLVRTTLGCSVVCLLLLLPFTVNNFLHDRVVMGAATSSLTLAASINIWLGLRGRYSPGVNTYLTAPAGFVTIVYTLSQLSVLGSYWPFLLILAFYFILPERRATVFNAATVAATIPLAWSVLDQSSAIRFSASLGGTSLFALVSMREIHRLHRAAKEQAVRDSLTGLFNRSLLEDSVQQAISQSQRTGIPMCLVGIDIDHFKAINDTLGHQSGDRALRELGALLSEHTRDSDRCFRIGGEEFLVLVHNADQAMGSELAGKLCRIVEDAKLLPSHPVTISAGVAALEDGMDGATWMKRCDDNLYRAKQGGRNQVVS